MGFVMAEEKRSDLLEIILHELAYLENTGGYEDIDVGMNKLLEAVQAYTDADRVYLFEWKDQDDYFTNTYEYCASGVTPQIGSLKKVFAGDMPYWYQTFQHGQNLVIQKVEDIRFSMPQEYALLKAQDIRSVIVFPVCHATRLFGFLGIDNPDISQSQRFINLLEVVGNFLGSVFDNRERSEKNRQAKEKQVADGRSRERDKLFLEILTQEYTSVFDLNLLDGKFEILKLNVLSNSAHLFDMEKGRKYDYATIMEQYADRYVVDNVESFRKNMSIANIRKQITCQSHISFRYRCNPNGAGQQYFEVQIIKMKETEDEFDVMISFRYIDNIIAREKKQQEQLKKALDEAELNNEIISAISKIYFSIFRIDLEKDYYDEVTSNSEIHRLTGVSGMASRKMNEICDTFVSEEYQQSVRHFFDLSTLAERLKDDDTVAIEYHAKDGNWHLARFIVKKRNREGKAVNVLYVTRLISDTKLREQNLILIAEEANRANEAKTEFLSRMAHDIRTPMNALSGFARIAEASLDNREKVRHSLHRIETACTYLQEIVDDVLDLTRIENGQITEHIEKVSLTDTFSTIAESIAAAMPEKHLNVRYEPHDILHDTVLIDVLHLKQIYSNLLSNAVKYTEDGGTVVFEIMEEKAERPGRVMLISRVKDNGIGMSQEFMKHMYDKFSRAVDTRVNHVRGSGLGLSVVRELVDFLDGTIDAKSEPGKGTVFTVSFEISYCSGKAEKEKEVRITPELCQGLHILVAEDNDLNYEVVEGMLAFYGITCEHAMNGAECVKMLSESPSGTFQAVLMDMQMPVMNGIEATRVIRLLEDTGIRNIPIIGLTANAFETDVQECITAGMNAHFSKPFDTEKLIAEILLLLKRN